MIQRPPLTIIAKPTHECNLACKYCYVGESAERGKMSEEILQRSLERVSDFVDCSHWIWHGGEPLLMGVDFFREIKTLQTFYEARGKKFSNGIQTNGTLLDDEILQFCEETEDFHIGTSLDGPEEIHNMTRIYSNGDGSFRDVLRGIKLAQKRGVGRGAICVISSENIDHPREIYDFFKQEGLGLKLNPLVRAGRGDENFTDLGVTPKQYGSFLIRMWNIYNRDVQKTGTVSIDVNPFITVIGNLECQNPVGCNYSSSCRDHFISIGPQGDVYPCGRFDGLREFWMGNVNSHSLEDIMNSPVNLHLKERSPEKMSGCNICTYQKICNGGCMDHAYSNGGDIFERDYYCSAYKKLFSKMEDVLVEETNSVKGGGK